MGGNAKNKNNEIKILLVDDDPDYLQLMSLYLQSKGYSVTVACNGPESLQKIKEGSFDVVFLDVLMPTMDGFTVLKRIREFNENLPVIIMSSHIEESKIEKNLNFPGFMGFFYKTEDFSKALKLLKSAFKTDI
jgi:CheY-like chemotaxis protein